MDSDLADAAQKAFFERWAQCRNELQASMMEVLIKHDAMVMQLFNKDCSLKAHAAGNSHAVVDYCEESIPTTNSLAAESSPSPVKDNDLGKNSRAADGCAAGSLQALDNVASQNNGLPKKCMAMLAMVSPPPRSPSMQISCDGVMPERSPDLTPDIYVETFQSEDEDCDSPRSNGRASDNDFNKSGGITSVQSSLSMSSMATGNDIVQAGIKEQIFWFISSMASRWSHMQEQPRTGRLARCVESPLFEGACILVISMNTIITFISANQMIENWTHTPSSDLQMMESFFMMFYVMELSLRIAVHRLYFLVNDDMAWNLFDLFLVVISGWPYLTPLFSDSEDSGPRLNISFLRALRVMKVARVLRLVRVIRFFRELRIMLDAVLTSACTMFWCLVLLFITVAMFSLVFVQFVTDYMVEEGLAVCPDKDCQLMKSFGSCQQAMLSLYMATTGGQDWEVYLKMLDETGPLGASFFLFYTAFYIFGLFNLLTGMFVDKATKAGEVDSSVALAESRLHEAQCLKLMKKICKEFDMNEDGSFSEEEFEHLMHEGKMPSLISTELGVDIMDMQMMFKMLRETNKNVPIEAFLRGCMRMKGPATSIDMQSVRFELAQIRRQTASFGKLVKHFPIDGPTPGNPREI